MFHKHKDQLDSGIRFDQIEYMVEKNKLDRLCSDVT